MSSKDKSNHQSQKGSGGINPIFTTELNSLDLSTICFVADDVALNNDIRAVIRLLVEKFNKLAVGDLTQNLELSEYIAPGSALKTRNDNKYCDDCEVVLKYMYVDVCLINGEPVNNTDKFVHITKDDKGIDCQVSKGLVKLYVKQKQETTRESVQTYTYTTIDVVKFCWGKTYKPFGHALYHSGSSVPSQKVVNVAETAAAAAKTDPSATSGTVLVLIPDMPEKSEQKASTLPQLDVTATIAAVPTQEAAPYAVKSANPAPTAHLNELWTGATSTVADLGSKLWGSIVSVSKNLNVFTPEPTAASKVPVPTVTAPATPPSPSVVSQLQAQIKGTAQSAEKTAAELGSKAKAAATELSSKTLSPKEASDEIDRILKRAEEKSKAAAAQAQAKVQPVVAQAQAKVQPVIAQVQSTIAKVPEQAKKAVAEAEHIRSEIKTDDLHDLLEKATKPVAKTGQQFATEAEKMAKQASKSAQQFATEAEKKAKQTAKEAKKKLQSLEFSIEIPSDLLKSDKPEIKLSSDRDEWDDLNDWYKKERAAGRDPNRASRWIPEGPEQSNFRLVGGNPWEETETAPPRLSFTVPKQTGGSHIMLY